MAGRFILAPLYFHPKQPAFYYLIEQNSGVIPRELVALKKLLVLFEEFIS